MAGAARLTVYDRYFAFADSDRDGRVTGKDAVTFFEKSGLAREILAKVWDMANSQRQGFLDRLAFHKAMDLIAIAQQGHDINIATYQAAQEQGGLPMPRINGFTEEGMPEPATLMGPGVPHGGSFMHSGSMMHSASMQHGGGGGGGGVGTSSFMSPSSYQPGEDTGGFGGMFKKKEGGGKRPVPGKVCTSVVDGLKQIYFQKVKPLEEQFKFGNFFSPLLTEADFNAKPSVLLLGQYSTGKTTFIKYLLGRDYPGGHIGPEPTTDRFVVVFHGMEDRRVPGNTLAVQPELPYQGLANFGTGFLSRFEGSQCPARLLEEITLVDTPGVLSGEKQRIERAYNFVELAEWFAARCDLIFLLFDPHKLDISDEFKQVISAMRGHDDKIRIILNKADQVDQQQLMRVYGALMWSLGKVFRSPEVCKVYVGSFNSEAPISEEKNPYGKSLFEAEQRELLESLYGIPMRSCDRKINEFVKRVRAFKIHLLLIGHMRKQMPTMFGTQKAQKKLMEDMVEHFKQVQREHHLPMGDFPDPNRFKDILSAFDLLAFPKLDPKMIKQIDNVLSVDIPGLVKMFDNPYGP